MDVRGYGKSSNEEVSDAFKYASRNIDVGIVMDMNNWEKFEAAIKATEKEEKENNNGY